MKGGQAATRPPAGIAPRLDLEPVASGLLISSSDYLRVMDSPQSSAAGGTAAEWLPSA